MNRSPLMSLTVACALVLSALGLAGCAGQPVAGQAPAARPAATPTVLDVAARQTQLSTFTRLAKEAGLADTLNASGGLTVFAPSDDAFKAVPAKTLDALLADKAALKTMLSYHVLPARLAAEGVKPGSVTTASGDKLELGATAGIVTVGDAMVTQADLQATNGVVHVIDRVLMPPKKK